MTTGVNENSMSKLYSSWATFRRNNEKTNKIGLSKRLYMYCHCPQDRQTKVEIMTILSFTDN